MNHLSKAITSTLVCLSISSCSFFSPSTQHVTIESSNPAATIKVNGETVGQGKASIPLKKNKSYAISATAGQKKGFSYIESEISTTGILDIIGGCFWLVPFTGLISKGAWKLDKEYVYVEVS